MTIHAVCPSCGTKYSNLGEELLGRSARCKQCDQKFVVTSSGSEEKNVVNSSFIVPVCPGCGKQYNKISIKHIGKTTKCSMCQASFAISTNMNVIENATSNKSRVGESGKDSSEWQAGDMILDRYEVKGILGKGGMGHVYRVYHKHWRTDLAVKCPLPKLIQGKAAVENFVREAETWIGLGMHPHIVSCYYVRLIDDIPRVFAECVEDGNLLQWIQNCRLYEGGVQQSLERILDIAIQFAWALHYAHERKVIHQDIKPANVMMTEKGVAKVTDFGLVNARAVPGQTMSDGKQGVKSTLLATYCGLTPAYCSPEQANLQTQRQGGVIKDKLPKLDRRTDQWSWAVSVLEMFTGKATWAAGQMAGEALKLYLKEKPPSKHLPVMPNSVVTILNRCFSEDPNKRYSQMNDIADALLDCYRQLCGQDYYREEPKTSELEAASLNNHGVSFWELDRKEEARDYFERAFNLDSTNVLGVYNYSLFQWRNGEIDDVEVLRRLENCRTNLSVDSTVLAELMAYIHAERFDFDSVKNCLMNFTSRYKDLFGGIDVGELQCVQTLNVDSSAVSAVAIYDDGRFAISGSSGKTLKLWDLQTGQCLETLSGHTGWVNALVLYEKGEFAVSGSQDATIKVWDMQTRQCKRTFTGHTDSVNTVAVYGNGGFAISGSSDETIKLWNPETGQCVRTLNGHSDAIMVVAVYGNGDFAISGSKSGAIKLWSLRAGNCIRSLKGHTNRVNTISVYGNEGFAISGSDDKSLKLWDLQTGRCLKTLEGHDEGVNAIAIYGDGYLAISGDWNGILKFWDLRTGQHMRSLSGHTDNVRTIAISRNGKVAISGSSDGTLKLWNLHFNRRYYAERQLSKPKSFEDIRIEQESIKHVVAQIENLVYKNLCSQALPFTHKILLDD